MNGCWYSYSYERPLAAAGCGLMHGEGGGVAVGWCVGGVGRVEGSTIHVMY
jgi:hypothetical protein